MLKVIESLKCNHSYSDENSRTRVRCLVNCTCVDLNRLLTMYGKVRATAYQLTSNYKTTGLLTGLHKDTTLGSSFLKPHLTMKTMKHSPPSPDSDFH